MTHLQLTEHLKTLPIVDSHVHIFAPDAGSPGFDPLSTFSFGGDDPAFLESGGRQVSDDDRDRLQRNTQNTMAYRQAVVDISGFLGSEPQPESILKARSKRINDFGRYVRELYDDAGIKALAVDTGHPAGVDLAAFEALTGAATYGICRIEPVIAEVYERHDDLPALERDYLARLEEVARDPRTVGFKTIVAYRTGLGVQRVMENDAAGALARLKRSPDARGMLKVIWPPAVHIADVKTLRDYLIWRMLELSIDLAKPVQVHTGWGDQDLDIGKADPALLLGVLRDPYLRHAKVVMLHGSYPFFREAAYIANIFPNVYLDLSLLNPFLGPSVSAIYEAVLDLAPSTKLMYSSDAYGSPELQWVAARRGKRALAVALEAAMDAGVLDLSGAQAVARQILAENACELYGLPAGGATGDGAASSQAARR